MKVYSGSWLFIEAEDDAWIFAWIEYYTKCHAQYRIMKLKNLSKIIQSISKLFNIQNWYLF